MTVTVGRDTMTPNTYAQVSTYYTDLISSSSSDQAKAQADQVARAFGYTVDQLSAVPPDANLGVSCGNPTAVANLHEVCCSSLTHFQHRNIIQGETVVDLGSGAGLDVFLASKLVGQTGACIGVDMNDAMLSRAHSNAEMTGYTNVEFVSPSSY